MADLHARFRALDRVAAPDVWGEVEQRATATVPEPLRVRLPALGRGNAARVPAWRLVLLLALLTVSLLVLALALGRDRQGGTPPFLFKSIGSEPGLHAVDVDTGESKLLVDGSARRIHVSPDGRYAFLEAAVNPTINYFDPGYGLVLVRTDGSEIRVITDRSPYEIGEPWESIWAPDSHAVAWIARTEGQLKVLDVAEAEPTSIDVALDGEPHVVWSPDNVHLAYVNWGSCLEGQTPHLFVVDTVASEVVEVGVDLDLGSMPGWSHDGGRLAASVRTGCPGGPTSPLLVVHDVATRQITSTEVGEELISPVWSPDDMTIIGQSAGRMLGMSAGGGELFEIAQVRGDGVRSPDEGRIAWLESDGVTTETYSLWVADLMGGQRRRIADDVRGDHPEVWPRWSPDGEWIAFARPLEIWVVRPDGSDERLLVGEPLVPHMADADW